MKKLFCMMDCETTGLEEHHEIIQIGLLLFDKHFGRLGGWEILVNAEHDPKTFSTEALEINGFDKNKIAYHGMSGESTASWIQDLLINKAAFLKAEKIVPCGHWILDFDIPKLRKFIFPDDEFDKIFCTREAIDTKVIANFYNMHDRFKSTSLLKLAEHFNIFTDGAHAALADCRRNLEVMKMFASIKTR